METSKILKQVQISMECILQMNIQDALLEMQEPQYILLMEGFIGKKAKCDVISSLFGVAFSSYYKGFAGNGMVVTTRDGTWIALQTPVSTDFMEFCKV